MASKVWPWSPAWTLFGTVVLMQLLTTACALTFSCTTTTTSSSSSATSSSMFSTVIYVAPFSNSSSTVSTAAATTTSSSISLSVPETSTSSSSASASTSTILEPTSSTATPSSSSAVVGPASCQPTLVNGGFESGGVAPWIESVVPRSGAPVAPAGFSVDAYNENPAVPSPLLIDGGSYYLLSILPISQYSLFTQSRVFDDPSPDPACSVPGGGGASSTTPRPGSIYRVSFQASKLAAAGKPVCWGRACVTASSSTPGGGGVEAFTARQATTAAAAAKQCGKFFYLPARRWREVWTDWAVPAYDPAADPALFEVGVICVPEPTGQSAGEVQVAVDEVRLDEEVVSAPP